MSKNYYESLAVCSLRYRTMLYDFIDDNDYWGWKGRVKREEATKLLVFLGDFIKGIEDELPLMKLNRWLGYIQGVLIVWGLTTVEAERDFTRPLFRALDYA